MLILSLCELTSGKTKTSDLFNEISYLLKTFIPNQLSVKKAFRFP
jgi:hypothetical protein